ncbi:MAG: amidohydrolase family protein [Candidatus Aenigmarchaeota archaeon]|nr:amidohydrolase family protein [Candidatus Aenigmarchaeota archaeon]
MEYNHDAHMHFTGPRPIIGHTIIDPIETYINYFEDCNIKTAFMVFDDTERFEDFRKECKISCPKTDVYGFYWIHDFNDCNIPDIADGLKTEAYIDKTDISQIRPILDSDTKKRPVYIHCGEQYRNLAKPSMIQDLADDYEDIKFIIGHSGAYAPPINEIYLRNYNISDYVNSAISVAQNYDNVHLESSILNNADKQKALIDALLNRITDPYTLEIAKSDKNHILNKLHLGTDYPLSIGDVLYDVKDHITIPKEIWSYQPTILDQKNILREGLTNKVGLNIADEMIAHIDQNTADFFGT